MSLPDGNINDAIVKDSPRKFPRQRWLVFIILGSGVLLTVGGFTYWRWVNANAITASDLDTVQSKANIDEQEHGLQAALVDYNKAISHASNKTVQGQLYLRAASMAFDNNAVGTALKYALKADNDLHTSSTSDFVAIVYRQDGNNSRAVTYYEKAANEAPASSQIRDDNKQFYLQAAQEAQKAGQ